MDTNARAALTAREERIDEIGPRAAVGHIPFPGHRTVAEVREHEGRKSITRRLGR